MILPTWYQKNCFYSLLLRCRINDHCKPFSHCHLLILIQLFTLSSKIQGAMPQTERKIYSCSLIFENPQKRTNCFVWRKLTRKMILSWTCIWPVKVKGLVYRLRNRKVFQNFFLSCQLSSPIWVFCLHVLSFVSILVNFHYGWRELDWKNLIVGFRSLLCSSMLPINVHVLYWDQCFWKKKDALHKVYASSCVIY